MSATKITTTMTRPVKNMASALLDDPLDTGRRVAADPWCLLPTLHRKQITGNIILELACSFRTPPGSRPETHVRQAARLTARVSQLGRL